MHAAVGKSTVTAAKAVHAAVTRAQSLTLVVSPSARQSGEFVRRAEGFVRQLGMRVQRARPHHLSRARHHLRIRPAQRHPLQVPQPQFALLSEATLEALKLQPNIPGWPTNGQRGTEARFRE